MTSFINPEVPLKTLFTLWPATIPVFIQRGMSCVGCSMSGFDTLSDAVENYGLDLQVFLAELQAAALGQGSAPCGPH